MSIKSYISKIDYQLNVIDNRKRIARNILKGRMADSQLALLTAEQTAAVDRVWGSRKKMFDWRWFELYNGKHPDIGVDIWKFIPVDYWLAYIDPLYAKPTDAFVFDDKNMYDLYFPDVRQPKTIVRYIDGLFLDSEYHIISEEEAFERCQSACRVLIKPAVGSCGGGGIALWDTENGSLEELKQVFRANQCYIVQEVVRQHPVMASLNASSCNTIRMLSFLYRGEVVVIPTAYARIGGKGSFIDNVSSGGYFVGIGREGEVYDHAQDHHGRKVDISVQGSPRIIPGYHKCQEIARTAAPRLSHITKLVAWDFAIGEDAEPVLIEVNIERTSIQSFQDSTGPILGDYVSYFLQNAPAAVDVPVAYRLLKAFSKVCRVIRKPFR